MKDTFMDTAKVMSKGQVTIPKRIRELLDLQNGDYVTFVVNKDKVQIQNSKTFIEENMRLRGLTLKKLIKNPILLFEYRLVPLLMCLSKTADDLTVSAMTKGLAVNQKRTSISESRIGGIDCIFFVIMVWAIYLYIRGKYA